nr:hypothetical protein [Escherichia coli]
MNYAAACAGLNKVGAQLAGRAVFFNLAGNRDQAETPCYRCLAST